MLTVQTAPPVFMDVGADTVRLMPPLGYTHARVFVVLGAVRRCFQIDPPVAAPVLYVGDYETLSGIELADFRMVRNLEPDLPAVARVMVEYRTEGA